MYQHLSIIKMKCILNAAVFIEHSILRYLVQQYIHDRASSWFQTLLKCKILTFPQHSMQMCIFKLQSMHLFHSKTIFCKSRSFTSKVKCWISKHIGLSLIATSYIYSVGAEKNFTQIRMKLTLYPFILTLKNKCMSTVNKSMCIIKRNGCCHQFLSSLAPKSLNKPRYVNNGAI